MTISIKRIFLLSILSVAVLACEKNEYQSVEELDEQNIQQYITQNNLAVQPYGTTGMYYQVLQEGDPEKPLDFRKMVPMVFAVRSLDGRYLAEDTLLSSNRYYDFLGYYPYGNSATSNIPSSPVEVGSSVKDVLLEMLQYENGKIRVIIPSRLLYGRNGNSSLGVPPNASLDYVFHIISPDDLPAYEEFQIRRAITDSGTSPDEYEKTESGIYYKIMEMGEGNEITVDSTITASYSARLLNGTEIDASDSAVFTINTLIRAWQEAIPKINKGGNIVFYTPSSEAYGRNGSGNIPQFTPLYFEMTVRDDD